MLLDVENRVPTHLIVNKLSKCGTSHALKNSWGEHTLASYAQMLHHFDFQRLSYHLLSQSVWPIKLSKSITTSDDKYQMLPPTSM